MPDLPTMAEAGIKGYDASAWFGILAPAGTPPAVVDRLNAEIAKVLELPEVADKLAQQGAVPTTSSPQEFAAYIRSETAKWAKVVKAAGAQID